MTIKQYIHTLPSWPDFTWEASHVQSALLIAVQRQGELRGRVEALGFGSASDENREATLATLTEDTISTSAIEGEQLNREQVRSSVARQLGIETGISVPVSRDVDGVVEMLFDATRNSHAPLTAERLYGWHAALFPGGWSHVRKIVVGQWRDGPMEVVSGRDSHERVHFRAPEAERLEAEMAGFLRWFNAPDDPTVGSLLKSAIAHLWFVTIHPFEDGNGRIGRALTDLLLARSDGLPGRFYSLSSQIAKERDEYYRILERTQTVSERTDPLDITGWLVWYLECLIRAIDTSNALLNKIAHKEQLWRRLVGVAVNERQREMLNRLFQDFKGKLTAQKWEQLMKVSRATALRDIDELVAHKVLMREDGGGRSTSYRLAD